MKIKWKICERVGFLKVTVEVSARHVHLSREAVNILFGKNYELIPKRFLSQPGQFLSEEKVEIVGPRGSIKNVAVLGPLRKKTQVELSITDTRKIGINTLIRESGNLFGSSGCEIIGPKGLLKIEEGVIIAKRHIHMPLKDAERNNLQDGQIVSVKIDNEERPVIFGEVVVRISEQFSLACHIDTDEANAAGIKDKAFGEII